MLHRLILAALCAACFAMPALAETCVSSWYGPNFHGRKTASGARFNQNALTAAHKSYRFGTQLRVSYRGRSVVVTVNDRGPFVRDRCLDLSKAAASRLGLIHAGSGRVSIQPVR